jgi:predicted RNA-binding protein YlxR (DUF448 family)
MLRFVVGADRTITPDPAGTAPGRGVWLRATPDALRQAMTRQDGQRQFARAAARSAKLAVTMPPDLSARLDAALVARVLTTIGLAKRARVLVTGPSVLAEAGKFHLALIPRDVATAERERCLAVGLAVVDPLTLCELRQVLAADTRFPIAVAATALSERLSLDAERLMGLRQAIATGLAGTAVPGGNAAGAHG